MREAVNEVHGAIDRINYPSRIIRENTFRFSRAGPFLPYESAFYEITLYYRQLRETELTYEWENLP